MNAFNLSFYGMASLIMDVASLFILGGMVIYTSLYRKRGKTEDKLFFWLILMNIAVAILSGLIDILDGFGISPESGGMSVCFLGFFLTIDAYSFLYCLYHMHRMEWEKGRINRMIPVILLSELILVILLFANVFTGNLYTGSIVLGSIDIYVYDVINLAPVIICGIFSFCVLFKRSGRMPVMMLFIIAAHIIMTAICVINVTPLFLSIYLMFSHLMSMKDSFYGEDD